MPDGLTGRDGFENGSGSVLKNVVCTSCDGFCPVAAKVEDGRVVKVTTRDHPILKDVICMKGAYAPKHFAHPDRILYPLKRVGARGDGQWQRVTWDEAMDDIAERLQAVIDRYGPEAFAVGQSGATGLSDHGLCRRFMNHVGSPNWISGVAYCAGNTAAVNRYVYGWFPRGDILHSKCIVLLGHDPRRHSWTMEYKAIRMAQAAGAKLIVVDPRRSGNAERADIWLPLRAGTDAALLLGWLRVIVDEELYDKEFVRDWTVGFDKLVERLREYPVERVAEITGLTEEQIRDSARMYATAGPACIPWSPITDQQVSSTSAIRLQAMLRAVTGNVDIKGGDVFVGPSPVVRSDSEIEMDHLLSDEQKAKQLGADRHPVFTFRGMKAFEDATERVWGHRYINLVNGCYMANPMAVFKAMEDSDPYPVRAFFMMANNALMAYANADRVYRAMMKQDLLVSFEHNMTPSAQISDYILPGDAWLERPSMQAGISEQAMEPPGECRNVTYFWHMLARRMGFGDAFPWTNQEDFINYRLEPGGATWTDVVESGRAPNLHRGQAPDPRGEAVSQDRLRHAVRQGGVLFRGAGKSRLRPAALLPRGGGALRALPVGDVRRLARGRVFPLRPPPYPGVAPARGGPDVHDRPLGDGAARLRGRRLGPARDLDRRHGRPRLWPLLHAGGPGAGAARLVEAGIAAGAGEHVRHVGLQ